MKNKWDCEIDLRKVDRLGSITDQRGKRLSLPGEHQPTRGVFLCFCLVLLCLISGAVIFIKLYQ